MKILWVNPNFLHPTTKGGQIRTLEIVKRLHRRHHVHYAAFADPEQPEGPRRAGEYSSEHTVIEHQPPSKTSPRFALQLAGGLFSPLPLAISRWVSPRMRDFVRSAMRSGEFDRAVCDFLAPAPHFDDLPHTVLFQHNVETMIWRRHAETAQGAIRKAYFRLQAQRMHDYEKHVCQQAGSIIAVSAADRDMMRSMFGARTVGETPTGVDCEYFARKPADPAADLVFVGSMDWMPNIDGMLWFVQEVLPLIRAKRPETSVAIAGRQPGEAIRAIAANDPLVKVTGTVPDIRPWLWGSRVSIVPLRVGGGTRLKIYEAMAAGLPVVSTAVGAEGLDYRHGENILVADTPEAFASACLEALDNTALAGKISKEALQMVAGNFSWDRVTADFEALLEAAPACR